MSQPLIAREREARELTEAIEEHLHRAFLEAPLNSALEKAARTE